MTAVITIEEGARFARNEALDIERKHFVKLAKSEEAKSLVGLFLNDQYIKGLAKNQLSQRVKTRNVRLFLVRALWAAASPTNLH